MDWVKLHQKIKSNDLIKDQAALQLFVWILANTNDKGEVAFSRYSVARELRQKPSTLYSACERLITKYQCISRISTTTHTVLKLSNWDKYQSINNPVSSDSATNQQPVVTIYKTKTNTHIQLTKRQVEKLEQEFPKLPVKQELEKFTAWQKANEKYFPNNLERFRLWLMGIQENPKQDPSRSIQKPVFKANPIINDPLFQSYLKVYYPADDNETRRKMALETQLNDKFSTFRYAKEWSEAKLQIPKFN